MPKQMATIPKLVLAEGPMGVDWPNVDFIRKFVELVSPPAEPITEVAN